MKLAAIFLLGLLGADFIKTPPAIPSDRGGVAVSAKSGGHRWSASWTMEPTERAGKKAIRFTEQGQGQVTPYSGQVRWSLESVWSADSGLRPLSSEKVVTSLSGARVATERKEFDQNKNTVRFERRFSDGRSEEKSMSIPSDTLAVEGIAGILRFLPFDTSASFPAHLLSNEPHLYSVTFEMRGKERIKTPAGEFES